MRKLRCPNCSQVVAVADGAKPVCHACGHGRSVPVAQASNPYPHRTHAAQAQAPLSVSGLLSLIFAFIPSLNGIIGLILGIVGMNQTKDGRYSGRGLAIAGTILNGLLLVVWVFVFLLFGAAILSAIAQGQS